MATIILTGGGTAGHCTPHLALLPYLKKHFDKIYYIGSKNGIEKKIIENANIPYFSVDCIKLNRSLSIKNLAIPYKLSHGILQARRLIKKLKPNVIFSKGGYVSIPTVIAGKQLNVPIFAHESDLTIGIANKISSRYCKQLFTTFEETAKSVKNGVFVGSPVRVEQVFYDKEKGLKAFNLTGKKPIIFVCGGSQGSQAINNALRNSLDQLLPKFDIIHACGKNNYQRELNREGYFQAEFFDNIYQAYAVCDVCVSRAGSNTLFELLHLKKPSLIIPLPKGVSRGDQVLNAEYFEKKGLISVLPQNVLTEKSLTLSINSTYANRFNLINNLNQINLPNACEKIVETLKQYAYDN